ncbi:MAG: SRPBCC domain-containing protein [Chloroflexi bacterium]|nr:SRPBCC domain-containing protein [Chloroflexota bacterium]
MSEEPQVGKTRNQGWEVGVRRTLPVQPTQAWQLILTHLGLSPAIHYAKGMAFETQNQTQVEIRSFKRGSLIRMKWQPPSWEINSTLQVRVIPAKTGTTISVHHEWLADAEQRAEMLEHWTALLEGFRDELEQDA